jgi:hypothetical protein
MAVVGLSTKLILSYYDFFRRKVYSYPNNLFFPLV